ncbi:hypothetical protein ALI22I_14135 [Saccharothrix sp. ALI-22-I]|uniref:tetratricopeptide repeat protein n=1 Tax=Saccharothrix sp. ALI-22-I TaxID=1933778 RepID=UPI00097C0551|nr:hypothetical protein [Saccharothrix sp. ALI-22-I]ONI90040.1 hypothetical protein ALI22I_14135 [Saccharothrix sp. ALI-22-I]
MDHLTHDVAEPVHVARSHDPLAVALANASLLGVGYLMLRRRALAVVTGLVTVVLVILLASVTRSVWFEIVVVLWWAALIVHGWFLAGGRTRRVAVRGQRLVALGVTVPVLLAVALLRFDAAGIEGTVTEARGSGDCGQASTALDRVWLGHRVVDAPLTARGEKTVQACQRLSVARFELTAGLTGDTDALSGGFDGLGSVLAELPGHEKMVDVVLDGFLSGLPVKDPCRTAEVTDWLRQRPATDNALDRSADVAARTAPAALVGCGDAHMAAEEWEQARTRYQQLLDQYPGQELTAKAQEGVRQATLAIELANVRGLLQGSPTTQPAYCANPAQYSGAAPYGPGTNRALLYGNYHYASKLPAEWRASDAAEAVLVVCAGEAEMGTPVQTCPYENKIFPEFPQDVTFRKIAIPVKVFELRTGQPVADTKIEIGGASCPEVLSYTYYGPTDLGPPGEVHVTASDDDVRAAFGSLINR